MLIIAATFAASMIAAGPALARDCDKDVTFIGFSADETRAAWHLVVACEDPAGRYTDRYSLVRVVDARTNKPLDTYRASGILRTRNDGRRAKAPDTILAMNNPQWAKAASREAWKSFKRQARFSAHSLNGRKQRVSVVEDPDVQLDAQTGEDALYVAGQPGRALGYTVALDNGSRTPLGRFRREARADESVTGTVLVMRSKSGRLVAVLNRFEVERDGDHHATSYGRVVRLKAGRATVPHASPSQAVEVEPYDDPSFVLAQALHDVAGAY